MSRHEVAVTTSTLSDIYIQKGQTDTAIDLLLIAAIEDIRNSTKETRAIFSLATLLFRKGDARNASTFIEKAVNDAVFYGARQRKVQLTSILPLIEAEKLNILQNEKKKVVNYAIAVTLSLFCSLSYSGRIKNFSALKRMLPPLTGCNNISTQNSMRQTRLRKNILAIFLVEILNFTPVLRNSFSLST
jgi:hypothetical protein